VKKKKIKIIFTGGSGRFGKILKKIKTNYDLYFPSRNEFDITNLKKLENFTKKVKPKFLIHAAALSRPMKNHDKDITKSIDTNIIGTSNIVKICSKFKIKLVYFSTNYVYPAKKGNYDEEDPILPHNRYGWSKLGGEAAVHMYKNSLILRICMTERPFAYNKAFANMKTNFIFHDEIAKNLFKLIKLKGVLNVGGKSQSIFNFAKLSNPKVKKIFVKRKQIKTFPLNSTMNISKFKKFLK
tara:strand:+ start:402 stop:1121 length:720 start_codon:yes stop_codon:yes gene_type:complete